MNSSISVLVIGLTLHSTATPVEGLDLLGRVTPPAFILLSSQPFPLMSYEDFLKRKSRDPRLAPIPVVLLSPDPVIPPTKDVAEVAKAPISEDDLMSLIKKFSRAGRGEGGHKA